MRELSENARAIWRYLVDYPGPHRPAEVQTVAGLSTSGLATYHLEILVARGLARRLPGYPVRFEAV
jgi:hypothetical protein